MPTFFGGQVWCAHRHNRSVFTLRTERRTTCSCCLAGHTAGTTQLQQEKGKGHRGRRLLNMFRVSWGPLFWASWGPTVLGLLGAHCFGSLGGPLFWVSWGPTVSSLLGAHCFQAPGGAFVFGLLWPTVSGVLEAHCFGCPGTHWSAKFILC